MKSRVQSPSILATALLLASSTLAGADRGETSLLSIGNLGVSANSGSSQPSFTGDGRFIVFTSDAANLVANDTNHFSDIFLVDRVLQNLTRISVSASGQQANGWSHTPSISRNGAKVAFTSSAPNLVPGDTNGEQDIFVRDLQAGLVTRVSTSASGSQGNFGSYDPKISADGRFVCFSSQASNLVANDTNESTDVFIKDLITGAITLISVDSTGAVKEGHSYEPEISGNGQFVVFTSEAILDSADKNGFRDIYVRDLTLSNTTLVSKTMRGVQSNRNCQAASISDDGRFITFETLGNTLVNGDTNQTSDIFLYDRLGASVTRVSLTQTGIQTNGPSINSQISADGRLIAFESYADNIVADDLNLATDIYVRDQFTKDTRRISLTSTGQEGRILEQSYTPTMTPDGKYMAFTSEARLEPRDKNSALDLYLNEYGEPIQMATLSLSKSTVAGENYVGATIQLTNAIPVGWTRFAVRGSSNLIQPPAQVTMYHGGFSKTFPVKVLPVNALTLVNLTVTWGNQTLTTGVYLRPLVPSAFQFTPNSVVGGSSLTARLVLNGVSPTGGKIVMIDDDNSYAVTPSSVVIPSGAPQGTFQISTLPVTATQYVTVTASVTQGTATGHFVIRPS